MDSTFSTIWALAQSATPITAMVFVVMWYLERLERLELRRERDALLEKVLTAMIETKDAMQVIRELVRR